MVEEENFPRGGKFVRAPKRPADENLFSNHTEQKGKRAKKARKPQKDDITDANFHSLLKVHGTLSFKEIQDGMLLLACVKQVHEFSIDVEMPGLTKGFVKITSISDPFTKYLNKLLEEGGGEPNILREFFKIGQFVLVKVLQAECTDNIGKLECTLNPREINSEKSHVSFKKGMLVWGCINSILDHGYELNVGVKNCRVFLPNKNVDEGKTFVIGEPLWVAIHKSDITAVATTLRVSAKEQHLKSNKVDDIDSLYDLIPGMQVEFLTEKVTATGIQGKFLNDYFGYIDETQLKYPLKKTENYKEGKLISAYVMYLESATKVTHLTMRSLEPQLELAHKIGDVVSAEVISKRHNGIYLKLQPNEKCFISNKRLVASLPHKPNEDISGMIRTKFSVGTKHTCRILDYWPFARTYVCTTEKAVIKEKIFNADDVHPGDLVDVTIERVKPEGLVVSCGRIKGFVPNIFLLNAEYSDNLKRKFKEGQKAKARVLEAKEGKNILLTLKPGQVESDKCLSSLSNVKRGENYTGIVVYTGESGAIVNFYGGVQGWLGKKFLFAGNDVGDMTKFFYRGQVVNVWALGTRENQVLLSMKPPSESFPSITLEVGSIVKGYIGNIREDSIDVTTKNGTFLGSIPNNHLSGSLNLCSTFRDTFKRGDKITDLMCVDNNNMNCILSRKEGLLHRNKSYKMNKFKDLKPGYQIRCFYISDANDGILVKPLILDFTDDTLIMKDEIVPAREKLPVFQKYQTIVAKIMKVDLATKTLQLTAKFTKVFSSKVEKATTFFRQHLAEVRYLKKFGLEHGWDLCQYSSGQRVNCKIDKVGKEGGCSVVLPNGVQGLVPPKLCPDGLQPGNSMEGVFLDVNFQHGYAEVCLKPELCEKINENQDGVISFQNLASCFAETILIKKDSVVCVLKQEDGNKQLVYCPIYLHENDWNGCRGYYESNKLKLKLCICGLLDYTLIGVPKRLFMNLDKQLQSIEKGRKMGKQIKIHPEAIEVEVKINEVNQSIKNNVGEKRTSKKYKLKPVDHHVNIKNKVDREDIEKEVKNASSEMLDKSMTNGKFKLKNKVERKQMGEKKIEDIDVGCEDIIADDANSTENEDNHNHTELNRPTETITSLLPGIKSFFGKPVVEESSSSEDDDEQLETVKKKKKLTPAEKVELARQEEERISKIEKELADSTKPLESAEQFDRKLLGNPNSSELWTRYMSFHIASTEIDKARTVAKRALEAINMTLTEERLNIWLAMLNLENMFGIKESFEKTFEEAVQYNDALTIYLRSIEMLAESGKFIDMEEKISKARRKFKQDPKMWLDIAKIYYQINKFKDARNLKDAALKSIQDKRTQMFIIVRFAILEFKYGEEDHGAAIFETVLSSDPKRVDIWSAYVDQLTKKNKIEQARRVLDKAITQRLPLKNMKTIFLKYRRFEEEHGTSDLVAAIKEKAVDYVNKALKK